MKYEKKICFIYIKAWSILSIQFKMLSNELFWTHFCFYYWISSLQITPFDPTKKKKKKKVVIQDPADDSVDKLAEKTEALSGTFANFFAQFARTYTVFC